MPKREQTGRPFQELTRLRRLMDAKKNEEWYEELTGRDIYEMDTISLMNQTVIDRPITLAMSNVTMTLTTGKGKAKDNEKSEIKSIDPESTMTNCMVDGRIVIRIRTGWDDLEIEDDANIAILEIDGKGYVKFIRIQYLILLPNGKPGGWFRRDYKKIKVINEKTSEEQEVSVRIDYPEVKKLEEFEKLSETDIKVEIIPFIPFVAQTWNKAQRSFLKQKRAFLELERVSIEISGENEKHSRRKLFVKAPTGIKIEVADLGDEINQLDEKGNAFYPDPHAAVIEGFFKERKDQIQAIENATGVVATEKIVALSGVSRVTAMKSLIDLSQKIRKKFIDLMIQIENLFHEQDIDKRQLTILVPPLGMLIVDVNNQAALLQQAHEDGHISDYELRESTRQMLSL